MGYWASQIGEHVTVLLQSCRRLQVDKGNAHRRLQVNKGNMHR